MEAVVAAWAAVRVGGVDGAGERLAVAVDGKSVRGARVAGGRTSHLLAAATHLVPVILAQRPRPE